MAARRFFYISAALLCLSLAFHFGYTTARAQAPLGNPIVGIAVEGSLMIGFTANGDTYSRVINSITPGGYGAPAILIGNFWSGGPVPAIREALGQVKARYRSNPVSTTPTTTDR